MASHNQADRDIEYLVISSIEVVLMRSGGPQYNQILEKMQSHNCNIFECFKHPELLRTVMHQIYRSSYPQIIQKIIEELGENMEHDDVRNFVKSLQII